MNQQRQPFRKFWELGYTRLVPIVPPSAEVSERSTLHKRPGSRGKAPGIRGADGKWKGLDWLRHNTTEADLDAWAEMEAGIGIRTGHGIIALDIDSSNDLVAHQAIELAYTMLGRAPKRIGSFPKAILVYASSDIIPYQRIEFSNGEKNERIELLTEGRQFVASGTHPGTMKPYTWPDGLCPASKLATITQQQIDAYFHELYRILPKASAPVSSAMANDRKDIDQTNLTGDDATVAKAVAALPNTAELFPTYDDYIRIGAAIKGATQNNPALGEDLFLQWAGRYEDNTPDQALADYKRIKPPYELGADYLYTITNRYNPTFKLEELWFQPIPEEPQPLFPTNQTTALASTKKFQRTLLTTAGTLDASTFAKPLVKGLLDQGASSVIYGRSNSGKTFVAMDLGFHAAAGMHWNNMRTAGLPTLYVAAEGGQGVRKRAAALMKKYPKEAATNNFQFILSSVDLFHEDADTQPLIDAVKDMELERGQPIGLIIIDTLARSMPGGDENSATDMAKVIHNVDRIRKATLAHVMIVHHSGKDPSKGARGSGALLAAIDTEIEIADNVISVTKQRDLDKEFSVRFALDIMQLGTDEDGDAITSCCVRLLEGGQVEVGIATPKEKDILSAVLALDGLSPGASEGVAMADIVSFMDSTPAKMGKEAVRFHLKALAAKGLIVRASRGKWKVKAEEKASSAFLRTFDEEEEAEESGGESGGNIFD